MSDEIRSDSHGIEAPSTPVHAVGFWASTALLLILLTVATGYAWHEHDVVGASLHRIATPCPRLTPPVVRLSI